MNKILIERRNYYLIKRLYLLQFFIVIVLLMSLIIHLLYIKRSENIFKYISNITSKSYSLSRLYQGTKNNTFYLKGSSVSVIGNIEIPSINISYPILSKCSEEFLKISVCKLYGPNFNEIGNVCIAGHNYDNDIFFSKLNQLKENDYIYISNKYSNRIIYSIYNIYEIDPKDCSFASQETDRITRINFNNL